ncbi:MAG: cytochrome P450 [Chromatiales bacterium]
MSWPSPSSLPRRYPFVGILPDLWRAPLTTLADLCRQREPMPMLGHCPRPVFLVNHPDLIRHVLQTNYRNYCKNPVVNRIRPLFGNGLTTSDGELWRQQRKLISPLLQPPPLTAVAPLILDEWLERWRAVAQQGGRVDILEEMLSLTRSIMGRTLFGPVPTSPEIEAALATAIDYVSHNIWSVVPVPAWVPSPRRLRFRHALRALDAFLSEQIRRRRDSGGNGDLLSQLMDLRDERNGLPLSETQLRDEVMTLFIAGYTTTATTLAWLWMVVSRYAEVENRLREELQDLETGDAPAAPRRMAQGYARRVSEETMRLYPPTWITARVAIADDVVGGLRIARGALLLLSPYAMHRHPDFWDEPERFDPDRFLPERSVARPRFAYFPFGGGPRSCIGMGLAMQEILWIVGIVIRRFRLVAVGEAVPVPRAALTLTPQGGTTFALEQIRS